MTSQKTKSVYPSPCEGKTTCMVGQLSQRERIPLPYKWDGCPSYLKKYSFGTVKVFSLKCPQRVFLLVISFRVLSQKYDCFVYNSSDVEGIKCNHLYLNKILKVLF